MKFFSFFFLVSVGKLASSQPGDIDFLPDNSISESIIQKDVLPENHFSVFLKTGEHFIINLTVNNPTDSDAYLTLLPAQGFILNATYDDLDTQNAVAAMEHLMSPESVDQIKNIDLWTHAIEVWIRKNLRMYVPQIQDNSMNEAIDDAADQLTRLVLNELKEKKTKGISGSPPLYQKIFEMVDRESQSVGQQVQNIKKTSQLKSEAKERARLESLVRELFEYTKTVKLVRRLFAIDRLMSREKISSVKKLKDKSIEMETNKNPITPFLVIQLNNFENNKIRDLKNHPEVVELSENELKKIFIKGPVSDLPFVINDLMKAAVQLNMTDDIISNIRLRILLHSKLMILEFPHQSNNKLMTHRRLPEFLRRIESSKYVEFIEGPKIFVRADPTVVKTKPSKQVEVKNSLLSILNPLNYFKFKSQNQQDGTTTLPEWKEILFNYLRMDLNSRPDVENMTQTVLDKMSAHKRLLQAVYQPEDDYFNLKTFTPSDPAYPWWNKNSSLNDAWGLLMKLKGRGFNRQIQIVGVDDSGTSLGHPDMKTQLWINQVEYKGSVGKDDDNNSYVDDINGLNAITRDGNINETGYHGTCSAGIIAAAGNNYNGIAGFDWNAKILTCQVFYPEGYCDTATVANCYNYFLAKNATVINNSWGGCSSNTMQKQFNQFAEKGVISVFSSGNNGDNIDPEVGGKLMPQSLNSTDYPGLLRVGATADGAAALMADFSNYGKHTVEILAPGAMIECPGGGNEYIYESGTSAAGPMVVGALSLLRSIDPDLTVAEQKYLLSKGGHYDATLKNVTVWSVYLDAAKPLTQLVGPTKVMPAITWARSRHAMKLQKGESVEVPILVTAEEGGNFTQDISVRLVDAMKEDVVSPITVAVDLHVDGAPFIDASAIPEVIKLAAPYNGRAVHALVLLKNQAKGSSEMYLKDVERSGDENCQISTNLSPFNSTGQNEFATSSSLSPFTFEVSCKWLPVASGRLLGAEHNVLGDWVASIMTSVGFKSNDSTSTSTSSTSKTVKREALRSVKSVPTEKFFSTEISRAYRTFKIGLVNRTEELKVNVECSTLESRLLGDENKTSGFMNISSNNSSMDFVFPVTYQHVFDKKVENINDNTILSVGLPMLGHYPKTTRCDKTNLDCKFGALELVELKGSQKHPFLDLSLFSPQSGVSAAKVLFSHAPSNSQIRVKPNFFNFKFWGKSFDAIKVNTDGYVQLEDSSSEDCWPLPSSMFDGSNCTKHIFAPFWGKLSADWIPKGAAMGEVLFYEDSTRAIVQWKHSVQPESYHSPNFEIIFYFTGEVVFVYETIWPTSPLSIGIVEGDLTGLKVDSEKIVSGEIQPLFRFKESHPYFKQSGSQILVKNISSKNDQNIQMDVVIPSGLSQTVFRPIASILPRNGTVGAVNNILGQTVLVNYQT